MSATAASLALGRSAADVVEETEQGDGGGADQDARVGPVEVDHEISAGIRIPSTIATPPMRGTGRVCTRGPVAAIVEAADPRREPRGERRQDEHDRGRDEEAPTAPARPRARGVESPKDMVACYSEAAGGATHGRC